MKQEFNARVDYVAARDVLKCQTLIQAEQINIKVRGEPCLPATAEECFAARKRLTAVRAQLWKMFLQHPAGIPYLLALLGFGVLMASFWGHAQPLPHGAIMLGWAVFIVGPTAWAMARAREAMYYELRAVRRELDLVERRLVRDEAERRAMEREGQR
ncbi:MAG: hypothetical protein JSR28_15300 [Proteobacteria bacterium]|nr:hypothetical protein [Pseudomonadota bacterium]